ncbi:MAG: hypothetical protein ACOX69_08165 [Coriobacteriales bacterium]|jgi:hypothetical protein
MTETHASDKAPEQRELSPQAKAAHERARRRRKKAAKSLQHAEDFRPEGEDDDGYDPYSDYMDRLSASSYEEPSADPWR